MPVIETARATHFYTEEGRGDPVVFVHGVLSDHRVWRPQRAAVAARHRFVAFDQRYFGTAPWPDDGRQFSHGALAADLAAFIDALGSGPAHVVGWSHGASVALVMQLLHPHRARSLFLYEPGRVSDALVADADTQRLLAIDREGTAPAIAAARSGDLIAAARRFIEWVDGRETDTFEAVVPPPLAKVVDDNARMLPLVLAAPPTPTIAREAFPAAALPTAIVLGEHTRRTWRIYADAIAREMPSAERLIIPGTRHLAPWQNAPAFNRTLLSFLDRCVDRERR